MSSYTQEKSYHLLMWILGRALKLEDRAFTVEAFTKLYQDNVLPDEDIKLAFSIALHYCYFKSYLEDGFTWYFLSDAGAALYALMGGRQQQAVSIDAQEKEQVLITAVLGSLTDKYERTLQELVLKLPALSAGDVIGALQKAINTGMVEQDKVANAEPKYRRTSEGTYFYLSTQTMSRSMRPDEIQYSIKEDQISPYREDKEEDNCND
jgi:hypothetical protein